MRPKHAEWDELIFFGFFFIPWDFSYSSKLDDLEEISQDSNSRQEDSGGREGGSSGGLVEGLDDEGLELRTELGVGSDGAARLNTSRRDGDAGLLDERSGLRSDGAVGVASGVEQVSAAIIEGEGASLLGAAAITVESDSVVGGARLADLLDHSVRDLDSTVQTNVGSRVVVDSIATSSVRPGDSPGLKIGSLSSVGAARAVDLDVGSHLEGRTVASELLRTRSLALLSSGLLLTLSTSSSSRDHLRDGRQRREDRGGISGSSESGRENNGNSGDLTRLSDGNSDRLSDGDTNGLSDGDTDGLSGLTSSGDPARAGSIVNSRDTIVLALRVQVEKVGVLASSIASSRIIIDSRDVSVEDVIGRIVTSASTIVTRNIVQEVPLRRTGGRTKTFGVVSPDHIDAARRLGDSHCNSSS